MSHGIYTATAGAIARQAQVDVEANNLANVSTHGFRAEKVAFTEVLEDATAPARHLVVAGGTHLSSAPGTLVQTGDLHDLSLNGAGFFKLQGPSGQVLARSLSLQVAADGRLVDRTGREVSSESGGSISVDAAKPFEVNSAGEVSQEAKVLGKVGVYQVADEPALEPAGGGTYRATEASGEARPASVPLVLGSLEASNVQPVESMVNLIRLERDFQSLLRAVNAYRETDQNLVDQVLR